MWTFGEPKGLSLKDLSRFLSYNTAKLARLDHRKGSIAVGMDADFVIWNPEETIEVNMKQNMSLDQDIKYVSYVGHP